MQQTQTIDLDPAAEAQARETLRRAVFSMPVSDTMWLYDRVAGAPRD